MMDSNLQKHRTVDPRQFRAARSLLDWTLDEAAAHCGVGRATLVRLERGDEQLIDRTVAAVVTGFEKNGVYFFDDERGRGVAIRSVR